METVNYINPTYHDDLKEDVLSGLTAPQKFIPSKYFYDARGSDLFEKICCLPEYYPTRTELSILKSAAPSIMHYFTDGDIVELGAGANWKIRTLLDIVPKNKLSNMRYVPVDVSEAALEASTEELLRMYPELNLLGIVADFTRHMEMIPHGREKLFVFFGSTIGNFKEDERDLFLKNVAGSMGEGDRFLLGIDMLKPRDILERAYNDSSGVTAEFNKNILNVLNRELGADFDLDHFDHRAVFNTEKERIEMYLQANVDVAAEIGSLGLTVKLEEGERILTEVCRKFTKGSVDRMAFNAGLNVSKWFSDPKGWFSLVEMESGNKGG
ncbi:MAG: L-histidine N(alpha)-methyltransferase [Nitrospirota bacterium]|nr:L-histidine N(alpha)-methyltransferase [Nitrospirota bacterium]